MSLNDLFKGFGTPTPGGVASFLGAAPVDAASTWVAPEPPSLDGIHDIIINFETNGTDWRGGDRPIGVGVGPLDGSWKKYLPFGHRGPGNLSEERVKEWFKREVRGKHITNARTKFEVHMSREWGHDLEEAGNTLSDVQLDAALLDDHRKRFNLDQLAKDLLGGIEVPRVDESRMADYEAWQVAARAEYQVALVSQLHAHMWPLLSVKDEDGDDLLRVRQIEDDVIYAVCEMEKNGCPIDVPLMEQMHRESRAEYGRIILEVSQEAGFAFDHSPKSWQRLFEKYGFPPSDSYAEDVIGPIDHPVIKKAHFAAQIASLNVKTFEAYPSQMIDGVLYYDINQLRGEKGGTVSGRFSIGFVQQVPNGENHEATFGDRWFPRRLFKAGPGYGFLEADAAQIEFRLLVNYTQNAKFLQAYRDDPDMSYHKMMQARLQTYKPDQNYVHTKAYNFAAQYGARSIKLATMMKFITEREGNAIRDAKRWDDPRLDLIKEIEDAVNKAHPEARETFDLAAHLAKSYCDEYCRTGNDLHRKYKHRGYVKTLAGRRSRFPDNYKTYIALNRVLQGGGADLLKMKAAELHRQRKQTGFKMRVTVHDSFLGDAQEPDTLSKVQAILAHQSHPLRVPITWECGIGANWATTK